MSIDINKIIQESVQETLNSQEEDEQTLEETTKVENVQENTENKEETTQENTEGDSYDPAAASAISAGLGALTFRNHYRALKEQAEGSKKSKWKTAGKIGAGLGAAGAAGAAGLAAAGEGDIGAGVEKAKEATSDVVGKFKNKISGGSDKKTLKLGKGGYSV